MPRLPRDVSGDELIRKLGIYGYASTRQTGSHVRLTRVAGKETQHLTAPRHRALRIGTVNNLLSDVAEQVGKSKEQVVAELFS